jgi:hypothetical protein
VLLPVMMPMPPGVTVVGSLIPEAAVKHGSGAVAVDVAPYRVDPSAYPSFRVTESRTAPSPAYMEQGMLRPYSGRHAFIEPTDTWRVRYKFKDHLLISSAEYDQRQCRWDKIYQEYSGHCSEWCLYIAPSGAVTGGWGRCPCPTCRTYFFVPDPDAVAAQDWSPRPYFVPTR